MGTTHIRGLTEHRLEFGVGQCFGDAAMFAVAKGEVLILVHGPVDIKLVWLGEDVGVSIGRLV